MGRCDLFGLWDNCIITTETEVNMDKLKQLEKELDITYREFCSALGSDTNARDKLNKALKSVESEKLLQLQQQLVNKY